MVTRFRAAETVRMRSLIYHFLMRLGMEQRMREDAGVDCRLHDLRHSFCTKLAEAGVPESTMLDMMGHMSAAIFGRHSRIRAKARKEAIEAIEARFSNGVAKESAKVASLDARKMSVTH